MRRFVGIVFLALGSAPFYSRAVYAQPVGSATLRAGATALQIDPRADGVLRRMTDYFGSLPAFSCHVESSLDLSSNRTNSHIVTKMSVRLARPNRLALVVDEGTMGVTVVSDGRQLVQYLPAFKRYVVSAAPPDLRGMTYQGAPDSITMLGTTDSLIPLSGPEFYRNLMASVTKAEYLDHEKVGDAVCEHSRCTQEDFDWEIWIDAGKQPLVHKVALDLTKYTKAGPQMPDTKIDYSVTFSDWNVAPIFTTADFSFLPPAGARQVAELIETPAAPINPLLGEVAPPFTAVGLDGRPIKLKEYLGEKVVLLAFWTTWNANCAKTLAEEDAISQKYAGEGVIFLPLNLGEKPAAVKVFLEKNRLAAPVLLDQQSEMAGLYQVQSIPHTVLIGKDKRVQVVHIGYHPNLTKILSSEIQAVLSGKNLAGETLRKADEAAKQRNASGEGATSDQAGARSGPTTPSH
ncbi:MAG TPA: DUF2092 domain-containing protein [Lacipirellulaceae bacterium]|nr:DUF2092 domain-containing protein [Lacipirellulaceae bacterium]